MSERQVTRRDFMKASARRSAAETARRFAFRFIQRRSARSGPYIAQPPRRSAPARPTPSRALRASPHESATNDAQTWPETKRTPQPHWRRTTRQFPRENALPDGRSQPPPDRTPPLGHREPNACDGLEHPTLRRTPGGPRPAGRAHLSRRETGRQPSVPRQSWRMRAASSSGSNGLKSTPAARDDSICASSNRFRAVRSTTGMPAVWGSCVRRRHGSYPCICGIMTSATRRPAHSAAARSG